jgi:hypothetical protein
MRRRALPVTLLLLLAACSSGSRGARGGEAGRSPSPQGSAARADSTQGPQAAGGRWYGYEGGLADAEASARSIQGAAQYWRKTEGSWRGADTAGTYVAYFDDNWLRRLEITIPGGTTGAYTYDERGRLFHYGGTRTRRLGRGRQARTERTTLSVALDGRGSVSATSKKVGTRAQSITQDEIATIIAVERAARGGATAGER